MSTGFDGFFTANSLANGILQQPESSIVSARLINGQIEIVRRIFSDITYPVIPPKKAPDKLVKEIYGIVGSEIALIKTIEGYVQPEQIIPESFVWQE